MVETRKVQVTGGSTYTVSIPKDWATDNGISAGSEVEFYPETDSLFMTPRTEDQRTEGTLDVTDLSGDELTRAVMTMYVSGFDIIALESARISTDQRRTIREATQGLVGLEVLEETRGRVVIRDLLDSSELSIHNAVTRMRLIALSMLEDAIEALSDLDRDMARDVIQRDDDVDRLWMVVSRIFRSTLRTPKAAEELGVPREVCFDYQSSARQLERIADHATKIAHISLELEEPVPDDVADALAELHEKSTTDPPRKRRPRAGAGHRRARPSHRRTAARTRPRAGAVAGTHRRLRVAERRLRRQHRRNGAAEGGSDSLITRRRRQRRPVRSVRVAT